MGITIHHTSLHVLQAITGLSGFRGLVRYNGWLFCCSQATVTHQNGTLIPKITWPIQSLHSLGPIYGAKLVNLVRASHLDLHLGAVRRVSTQPSFLRSP